LLLNADQCQRAARTHDPRFDDVFFIGIITTRIYSFVSGTSWRDGNPGGRSARD
jgi:methylphosphotriester-DNA--protein-cysteine methyltransferase